MTLYFGLSYRSFLQTIALQASGILAEAHHEQLSELEQRGHYLVTHHQISRGQKCPCGSGRKLKRCCGKNQPAQGHVPLPAGRCHIKYSAGQGISFSRKTNDSRKRMRRLQKLARRHNR